MIFSYSYKAFKKILKLLKLFCNKWLCIIKLKGNNVQYSNFRTTGVPYIMVARGGRMTIGNNFAMNNGITGNPIGCYDSCTFFVDKGASLRIGENVGISQAAIVCTKDVVIGNFVKIGGGVKIYDTDFHSLDPKIRASKDDVKHRKQSKVLIRDNAFIGAFSIILKGITIGENSIVGAGSVVSKSVPDNEIWAGNPAKFIKAIK